MKTLYLLIVCTLFVHPLVGKIRNGYEPRLEDSRTSLQSLNLLFLKGKMSGMERLQVKSKIEVLVNYISFYELTDEFIRQFRIVAPVMFTELDNIRDKRGRFTDIYIRLIPTKESRIPLVAASFFQQTGEDEDASVSPYGMYSVSVDIFIVDNALFLLSHELGHVKYIVPNLATYSKFYKWRYNNVKADSYIGHSANDLSGEQSHIFERRFLEEKKVYFRNGGRKPMSLPVLLTQIKKNTQNQEPDFPLVFASNYGR